MHLLEGDEVDAIVRFLAECKAVLLVLDLLICCTSRPCGAQSMKLRGMLLAVSSWSTELMLPGR